MAMGRHIISDFCPDGPPVEFTGMLDDILIQLVLPRSTTDTR